jgi:hypothetical protein
MSLPPINFLGQGALLQKSRVATNKSITIGGTVPERRREVGAVLRVRNGFSADPDTAFFVNADSDPDSRF